jgi:hypothetical protein
MSRFKFQRLFTPLAFAFAFSGAAASAAPCQTFAGLQHCAVDGATLGIAQGKLVVTGAQGSGGVSIATPGATSWSGESRIKLANGAGDVLESSSLSQGVVTSGAKALRTANGTRLSATFTASSGTPSYTTQIFRDGALVATAPNNASGSTGAVVPGPVVLAGWENLQWPTFIVATGGSCTWSYRTTQGADRTINLPDGRSFVGDEIRFSENVAPQGAYPYLTFDALVFQGDLATTQFISETVQ